MVRKGDILYNPFSRATLTFILTGADTAGTLLQLDISIAPGGKPFHAPLHVHPKQQEVVTIKSGRMWATINGLKRMYGPGEIIQIPAGTPHQLENASQQEDLNYLTEMTPALGSETLYETTIALALSDNLHLHDTVPILQLAITLHKHSGKFYLTDYPVWFQKILYGLLAPVALLMGYKAEADYKEALSGNSSPSLLFG